MANLLELRDELRGRGLRDAEDIRLQHEDVTKLVADSQLDHFRAATWAADPRSDLEHGGGDFCVRAVVLPGLAQTLSWPTQPGLTFAHELMGRVRVIACLDQQPTLIHNEKWPDYEGSQQELERLRNRLDCGGDDALIVTQTGEALDPRSVARMRPLVELEQQRRAAERAVNTARHRQYQQ